MWKLPESPSIRLLPKSCCYDNRRVRGVGLFPQPSRYNRGFMASRVILTGQHQWHVRQRNAHLQELFDFSCTGLVESFASKSQGTPELTMSLKSGQLECESNVQCCSEEFGGEGAEKLFRDAHDLCLGSPLGPPFPLLGPPSQPPIKHTSVFIAYLKCPSVQYLSLFCTTQTWMSHIVPVQIF